METYIDRWGKTHTPDENSVIKGRAGAFGILIVQNKILLTWPGCAPDVPELPGGGIDPGETAQQAMTREMWEEAAVELPFVNAVKTITQRAYLKAENCGEFWHYDQTYFLLKDHAYESLLFEGETSPEDALKARWVDVSELPGLQIHAVHWKVLENLL
ncbi:MAG: NUDIX hydrolase [Rhodospirillales bacterium]|nr:NUDIX hydrolase [Rhodospirillales bacterium]